MEINRRKLLKGGLVLAGASLLPGISLAVHENAGTRNTARKQKTKAGELESPGRRKLGGKLEVSSIGLGVQNMWRTYQTTIPSRPEMINIIRTAFDHDVTLFDTAEAYGPFESERILGEGVAPFRNKIVIETKFG